MRNLVQISTVTSSTLKFSWFSSVHPGEDHDNTVQFFQSGTNGTRQVLHYQILQINKQNLQWPSFLEIIFFVTSQPATRECAAVSYFHFIVKRLHSSNYHRPSHSFSFRTQCCKPLIHACPPTKVSGFPEDRHQDYRKCYCTFKHDLLHIQVFQFHSSVPTSCIVQCSITSAVDSTVKWSTIHSLIWIITIT